MTQQWHCGSLAPLQSNPEDGDIISAQGFNSTTTAFSKVALTVSLRRLKEPDISYSDGSQRHGVDLQLLLCFSMQYQAPSS